MLTVTITTMLLGTLMTGATTMPKIRDGSVTTRRIVHGNGDDHDADDNVRSADAATTAVMTTYEKDEHI